MLSSLVTGSYPWRFFRSGGFDQVQIENADDLKHLSELDQKLWSVLACPTVGLEFDPRTLALLDSDGDGRIRAPEIIRAVRWAIKVLKTPDILFEEGDRLPLEAINHEDEEGAKLLATAEQILQYLGKRDADVITIEDVSDTTQLFTPDHYNGDGIIPVQLTSDETLIQAMGHIMACYGEEMDRSGQPGINQSTLDQFFNDAHALSDWLAKAELSSQDILPLGESTAAAADLFALIQIKVDDFFTRCQLAVFDEKAAVCLNPADELYQSLASQQLHDKTEGVAALPLALVAPGKDLPLNEGINPAWSDLIQRFKSEVILPILGDCDVLTLQSWNDLSARFTSFRQWMQEKPESPVASMDIMELRSLLTGNVYEALADLILRDLNAETAAELVEGVERLTRYNRDLVVLLKNYVNLSDFYGGKRKAIFQAGTLYLDQRSCELCLRVADLDRHSQQASLSGAYLVYCQCTRLGESPMTIVAAMTGGDADDMMVVGRNGIFYDRHGYDWHASVVKVIENPISVRQAFWSPYKRIARMMGEQIQKFAAAKDKAVEDKSSASLAEGVKPAVSAQAFDIAKFAGIFAAIGLAFGALGTALAAIVSSLIQLPLWKVPLVFVVILLLISGPSMLLASLKLRKRNLGPLLDANGWAVNTRARINIPFGGSLTGVASLPKGAKRTHYDPFADQKSPWRTWLLLVLLFVFVGVAGYSMGWFDPYFAPQATEVSGVESVPADAVVNEVSE
ncbi:hypothetical protein [Nitrincola tibetensis]|uniref:hypothetical protein n=1 Tax=Nitrincola tibetensis TaxID=2219697 RepID=UPI0019610531|nr:hypothetical protein [Nitrincola tibetensis]